MLGWGWGYSRWVKPRKIFLITSRAIACFLDKEIAMKIFTGDSWDIKNFRIRMRRPVFYVLIAHGIWQTLHFLMCKIGVSVSYLLTKLLKILMEITPVRVSKSVLYVFSREKKKFNFQITLENNGLNDVLKRLWHKGEISMWCTPKLCATAFLYLRRTL